MTKRTEFPKSVKLAAWDRCKGRCECCGVKIIRAEYDHIVPYALSQDSTLSNCMVLDSKCHRIKTSTVDIPRISKAKRGYEKRAGVRKTSRGFPRAPEGYNSWTRRMREE